MGRTTSIALLLCIIVSAWSLGAESQSYKFQNVLIMPPSGWKLDQDAAASDTLLMGFSKANDYIRFYARRSTPGKPGLEFITTSTIGAQSHDQHGPFYWDLKEVSTKIGKGTSHVVSFSADQLGYTYYGYSSSKEMASARTIVHDFLNGMMLYTGEPGGRSLTGPNYKGKNTYSGMGSSQSLRSRQHAQRSEI